MKRIQLTTNFYLDEFTRSQVAVRHGLPIRVTQGSEVYRNLKTLCLHVLQPLRDALGPVTILSGYRPQALNRLIGGADSSQHLLGEAVDIHVPGYTPLQVCRWIEAHRSFDQLIHEFGSWTHVSLNRDRQRHQALTSFRRDERVVFELGLKEVV